MILSQLSRGRRLFLVGICLSALWCGVAPFVLLRFPDSFENWNNRIYDGKLGFLHEPRECPNIVHVDVDDAAIQKVGQWPWDRAISAKLVARLAELGARVVMFDILYSSPGKTPGGDEDLARAVAQAGAVVLPVGPSVLAVGGAPALSVRDSQRVEAVHSRSWELHPSPAFQFLEVQEMSDAGLPLLPLIAACRSLGHIKASRDRDGVFRRVPLLIRLGNRYLPSLSLAALMVFLNAGPDALSLEEPRTLRVRHGDWVRSVPVDSHGNMLLNWIPAWESFPHYTVLDLLSDEPDPARAERYKGKIVIVGVAWTGTTDTGTTPLENEVLLSRSHSCALDTILTGRFVRSFPPFPYVVLLSLTITITFIAGAIWLDLERQIIFFSLVIAAFVGMVLGGFSWLSWEIPSAQPLFVFVPAAATILAFRAAANERERTMIRQTFGRYLSDQVVDEILKSPDGIALTGELREVTILVSDLRGFTPMTESLPPTVILQVCNRYLEKMTDIVISHEGTINEVMGDGLLVFFGAPRAHADDPLRAVSCALEMQAAMPELNAGSRRLGLPELKMGIGINTGVLVVGNIGSEKRKKYGAMGSAINVAFRVEAQTTGGEVLITPAVYVRYAKAMEIGSTRLAKLKGIEKPMTLYEVQRLRREET